MSSNPFTQALMAHRSAMTYFDPSKERDNRETLHFPEAHIKDSADNTALISILVAGADLLRCDGTPIYTLESVAAADPPWAQEFLDLKRFAPAGWFANHGAPLVEGASTPVAPPAAIPQSAPPAVSTAAPGAAPMNRGAAQAPPLPVPAPTAPSATTPGAAAPVADAASTEPKKPGWPKGKPRKTADGATPSAAPPATTALSDAPTQSAVTAPTASPLSTSAPTASPAAASASAETPISNGAKPIGTLYVKCAPLAGADNARIRYFEHDVQPGAFELVRTLSAQLAAQDPTGKNPQVDHWRYMPFGKGPGLIAEAVASVVEATFSGHDLVILMCDELDPCYSILASLSERVVRGVI